jgi:hypothetical protein
VVKYTHSHPGNRIDRKLIKSNAKSVMYPTPLMFSFQF